ncbi:MAG: twin-arginine translocation signal domain-containing protein [Smithellaceae bacterium]|nr:twin-arginine translocation signal domain-containing protein [Smithellaceae bacterium]
MKNDLIKSVHDLEEKSESIGRRDFIKKAGIAGLALAGLGSLGGCARVYRAHPEVHLDFDVNSHKQYDSGPIPIRTIEDFLLSGEEIYGMRLTWPVDKHYIKRKRQANPMFLEDLKKGKSLFKKAYSWKRLMDAEYTGKTNFPNYFFYINIREKENSSETEKRIKILKDYIESLERAGKVFPIANGGRTPTIGRIYSKNNFICSIFTTRHFINEAHKNENTARLEHYQKKRGLTLHWKNG